MITPGVVLKANTCKVLPKSPVNEPFHAEPRASSSAAIVSRVFPDQSNVIEPEGCDSETPIPSCPGPANDPCPRHDASGKPPVAPPVHVHAPSRASDNVMLTSSPSTPPTRRVSSNLARALATTVG